MTTFKSFRRLLALCLLAIPALPVGTSFAQSEPPCQTVQVIPIAEPIEGSATFCTAPWGVKAHTEVMGLTKNNAYTVWFIYFDDPSQCVHGGPGVCGDADFFTEDSSGELDPVAVLGRFDSVVARKMKGNIRFQGRVRGLAPTPGSQVWLLTFGHGPADTADGRHLARQLLTPEDPAIGVPHLGNNVDGPLWSPASVAIFNIP